MKNIQNINGAKALSNMEQKNIMGGDPYGGVFGIGPDGTVPCTSDADCAPFRCMITVGNDSGYCNRKKL